jgi:3-methyladenine DNA glycosylase/8-oxoguanine DNA glycosylase
MAGRGIPEGLEMGLRLRTKFEIDPIPPFNFRLTVRKPAGWDLFTREEIYEDDTLWTAIRFKGMPLGLKMQSVGTMAKPRVRVEVYSEHAVAGADADRLRDTVGVCLGAEQDLNGFYDFAMKDDILRHVVESLYGMHDTQAFSLFDSVILSICLQMARLKRSMEMMDAIHKKYGETIEFDEKRVGIQPTAEMIAKLDPAAFAKECKLGSRAKYIVASAKMIAAGFPDLPAIMEMPPENAKEKLLELPGIGDYAADIINPHSGFPIDAWSVDVFGLLFFGKEPEDRRNAIEEVKREGIRRWGTWSWMAFFYVAQDLKNLSERLGIELRLE